MCLNFETGTFQVQEMFFARNFSVTYMAIKRYAIQLILAYSLIYR